MTLADAGFDIVHAFDAEHAAREFPWLAPTQATRLGILVGNTRALWPRFAAALPALAGERDPLDRYTERAIAAAYPGARTWFTHVTYDGAYLPLQRLAVATGLAALAPTQLLIHPVHGPWFALRAVIVMTGDPPPVAAAITKPCACDGRCEAAFAVACATMTRPAWLAVRDACTIRASRYTDEQIHYHYSRAFPPAPEPDVPREDGATARDRGA